MIKTKGMTLAVAVSLLVLSACVESTSGQAVNVPTGPLSDHTLDLLMER